jgi:hypothetical protein
MMIVRNSRRAALVATVLGAMGLAAVSTATTAFAANSINVNAVGPVNVGVDYSCDASAGVVAIRAMVGDPNADRPSAIGTQNAVSCDGVQHAAVVVLTGTPLSPGQRVQVRVALVDRNDTVVSGQAKVVSLG